MKLAYTDTSIWITRIEGLVKYQNIIGDSLLEIVREGWRFCISDAVILETIQKPYRLKCLNLQEDYDAVFAEITKNPGYSEVFQDAIAIVQQENLKAMDAIHVAFALKYGCELFVTTDTHFKNVKYIPVRWIDLQNWNCFRTPDLLKLFRHGSSFLNHYRIKNPYIYQFQDQF